MPKSFYITNKIAKTLCLIILVSFICLAIFSMLWAISSSNTDPTAPDRAIAILFGYIIFSPLIFAPIAALSFIVFIIQLIQLHPGGLRASWHNKLIITNFIWHSIILIPAILLVILYAPTWLA